MEQVAAFMEGTGMVATASPAHLAIPRDSLRTIKVLDLLTNRYHVGRVQGNSDNGLEVCMPSTTRFHAGQRVRYVLAAEDARMIVARQAMQSGFVAQVNEED